MNHFHVRLSQLIEVGVNGVCFAYNLDDNSYVRLKNVRIPHTQMPMKRDEVDEKGSNIKNLDDDCLLYGTLLQAQIYLCDTFIIATCCSAVRFQRQNPQGNEIRLLDYRLQQEKLVSWFLSCAIEGDNIVLLQQTARYRWKILEELEHNNNKNINPSVTYSNTQL
ncbi:unnamed protein product [Adineta ricciae]|uniref:Uncharacterized protein n=1 Tax=Adineta ricciae TaxID=249248 RepID=A0A816GR25_ADIRI|nr:unnamed protein product [Adineta ricciae]